MKCRDVEDRLIDLEDGRLEGSAEIRLHAHVEDCAECRAHVETWRKLVPLLRATAPAPPSVLAARRMEVVVERGLAAAPRPAPRRSRMIVGLVAAAAAAVVLAFAGARLYHQAPRVLDEDVALAAGQSRELRIGRVATVRLSGPMRLRVEGDTAHARLRLDEGRLIAEVAHRRPDETFVVIVPQGRVEVRGTRFVVEAGAGASSVCVEEGRVAVFDRDEREHSVGAGESYSWRARTNPDMNENDDASANEAANANESANESANVCPRSVRCGALTAQVRKQMRARRYEQALEALKPALHERACAPRVSACRDELGYLDAEALRQSGQLEAAVAAYKALARKGAPPARRQNALYAAAQLERDLGRVDAARADFLAAHAAAPTGALADEALAEARRLPAP